MKKLQPELDDLVGLTTDRNETRDNLTPLTAFF